MPSAPGDGVAAVETELATIDWTASTLVDEAIRCMGVPDPVAKAARTDAVVAAWRSGSLRRRHRLDGAAAGDAAGADAAGAGSGGTSTGAIDTGDTGWSTLPVPDEPARPDYVEVVPQSRIKQGSKKALVHSIVHAESYAIDLSWDIIARFGPAEDMPREFYDDWLRVASEEGKHFRKWRARLLDMTKGKQDYGALKAHDGLWQSATDTAESLLGRLAVVHMVHEARGLDVSETIKAKLSRSNPPDTASIEVLEANVAEEVFHVGFGVKWFKYLCERDGLDAPSTFHTVVRSMFKGILKPPFNDELRAKAGMDPVYYVPLSTRDEPAAAAEAGDGAGGGDGAASAGAGAAGGDLRGDSAEGAAASATASDTAAPAGPAAAASAPPSGAATP